MSFRKRVQQIQDINGEKACHFTSRFADGTYEGFYYTLRRSRDDAIETVYMNTSLGFIDDDSLISDGVTTLATWKEAVGASNLYVAQWWDISGSGNHLTQGTSSNQPLVTLNGSGVPADFPYFDGINDCMEKTITEYSSPSTLFIVFKAKDKLTDRSYLFTNSTGITSALRADSYQTNIDSTSLLAISTYNSSNDGVGNSLGAINYDVMNVLSMTLDGTALKGYLNGINKVDRTITGGHLNKYRIYKIGIDGNDSAGFYFYGYIAELVLYNRIFTDSERQNAENELMKKYNIV